ncbi:TPA: DUF1317 family protein [Escherichia coli]|nr:DUF1317 family protein [Escherichia coli]EEV6159444.1 DUF1317 family protein [Escherichia coli]EEV6981419.1 DUF1317 family protein [Escherichia coli]EFA3384986.1 DUF1317 family protein [Escherichia coli]EFB3436473.1 DUF1317 family protein [Escherichia coli]
MTTKPFPARLGTTSCCFNAAVGAITFVYSVTKRGWVFPGLSVTRNPLKAQRLAEEINNKRGAVCTKHLLLS